MLCGIPDDRIIFMRVSRGRKIITPFKIELVTGSLSNAVGVLNDAFMIRISMGRVKAAGKIRTP